MKKILILLLLTFSVHTASAQESILDGAVKLISDLLDDAGKQVDKMIAETKGKDLDDLAVMAIQDQQKKLEKKVKDVNDAIANLEEMQKSKGLSERQSKEVNKLIKSSQKQLDKLQKQIKDIDENLKENSKNKSKEKSNSNSESTG